ncbi:quinol monooxygenase YgiN [Stackebrandtia albiflava]|uniref:Quinol monooxygenase YgiN n=1 Tax=Stackebrandtia albiflava TaxID=406432 RepID=A0A562UYU6_9ACTN|nr:putative quinol monooxygenase [Stackebrandtia albiflava]TWJ10786.1 quinol monooxygenase YgiN [Stackebrandtia albiflava]
MYSLYGFVTPAPGMRSELREVLLSLVAPSRAEPGNVEYHLHEEDDGRFFLYEVWRGDADFAAHMETPHMTGFARRAGDLIAGAPEAYHGRMISPPVSVRAPV